MRTYLMVGAAIVLLLTGGCPQNQPALETPTAREVPAAPATLGDGGNWRVTITSPPVEVIAALGEWIVYPPGSFGLTTERRAVTAFADGHAVRTPRDSTVTESMGTAEAVWTVDTTWFEGTVHRLWFALKAHAMADGTYQGTAGMTVDDSIAYAFYCVLEPE